MGSVNERIFDLLGNKHGVQKEFATFIGVSDRNVNAWKSRGSAIDAEYIPAIAEFLNVDAMYLLTGKESQKENDFFAQEEIKLVMSFRTLPTDVRQFVLKSVTAEEEINAAREKYAKYIEEFKKQSPSALLEIAE